MVIIDTLLILQMSRNRKDIYKPAKESEVIAAFEAGYYPMEGTMERSVMMHILSS